MGVILHFLFYKNWVYQFTFKLLPRVFFFLKFYIKGNLHLGILPAMLDKKIAL